MLFSYKTTKKSSVTGFTLVEIMVSMVILTVVIIGIIAIFDAGRTMYYSNTGVLNVQQVARSCLGAMSKEIRQSKSADVIISNGGTKIDFVIPVSIDPVSYSSTISYYLNNGQLIREHPPGTTSVLAINIDSLNFSLDAGQLEIDFQVRETQKHDDIILTLKESIVLRN